MAGPARETAVLGAMALGLFVADVKSRLTGGYTRRPQVRIMSSRG